MLMRKRLLPGVLVLALALVAGMAQAADNDKYLPNTTEGVVTVNVKQLLAAPLVKANLETAKALLGAAPELQQALDDIGFDPFKDVDTVVLAIDRDPSKSVIFVNGKFDTTKIAARAEKAAKEESAILKVIKSADYTYYSVKPPETKGVPNETMYVALLDGTTLVAAPTPDAVVDALDKKADKKKSEVKPELRALLAKADREPTISIVSLTGPLSATGQAIVEKLNAITGGITVGDDVKAAFVLSTKNAKDADSVESELKAGIDQITGLAELVANQNKELKPLVDAVKTLKVAAQGNAITLTGQLSKEVLDRLVPKGQ
jgi:hypothetical protein